VDAITRLDAGGSRPDSDLVAIEAPLELLLVHPELAAPKSLGLLMRTPGDDPDLVLGFLLTEGVIERATDVERVEIDAEPDARDSPARATATLRGTLSIIDRLPERVVAGTSACGLCGRVAMRALDAGTRDRASRARIPAAAIHNLPASLRAGQAVFAGTGGLHAAALCDFSGQAWLVREDVGRHNAVDKVVGAALAMGRLPASEAILAVSGRVAYEIVQKAVAAGVAAVVAVGAPSSLAVDAARAAHLTLAGFARDGRFNVYAGADRLDLDFASGQNPTRPSERL
jgi:FdhD protein